MNRILGSHACACVQAAGRTAPRSCKFAIGYFYDVQVCNVEGFRPTTKTGRRGDRSPIAIQENITCGDAVG